MASYTSNRLSCDTAAIAIRNSFQATPSRMSSNSPPASPTGLWTSSARSSTRSSIRTGIVDPPRPAMDGHEWVWFPEGYWAERPVARRDSSKVSSSAGSAGPVGKLFKLTMKPTRNSTDAPQPEQRDMSPRSVVPPSGPPKHLSHFGQAANYPQSPYLSEEAHVQSLQHPMPQNNIDCGYQDTWKSPPSVSRLIPMSLPISALISPSEKKIQQLSQVKNPWKAFRRAKEVGSKPSEL